MRVIGKRVLVESEKLDSGGLRLSPETEESGLTNSGIIKGVGNVGLFMRLKGLRKGKKIFYKKHFTTNMGKGEEFTFVSTDEILGIY